MLILKYEIYFLNVFIERVVVFDINIGVIYVFYFYKRYVCNVYIVIY